MHFLNSLCLYPHILLLIPQGAGNYHESIALGIDVRKQLGLKTPKDKKTSVWTILKGYMKTNWLLANRSAEELTNLPELTNERIIMGQMILELMEISCYQVSTREMRCIVSILVFISYLFQCIFNLQAQPTMFALLVFLLME